MKCVLKKEKGNAASWLLLAILIFLLSTGIVLKMIPRTWAIADPMEVYQQSGHKVFATTTSLDIFDENASGQKLIHPFSDGTYVFAVFNNSGSGPLSYSLDIEAINPGNVPMIISLEKNGVFIYGGSGETNMLPLSKFEFPECFLSGYATDIYTLRWAWNEESDIIDTNLGNDGTQLYSLIITAKGTIDETEIVRTGDRSNALPWIALGMFGLSLILILLFWKRKQHADAVSPNTENGLVHK